GKPPMKYQYCVIGGGIIGLATARELALRDPSARIVLIEKEAGFGLHQTGHNSGVIHAGIYYAPGSLKARLCREGAQATKQFCRENGIPFETCGKLLVATSPPEMERMTALEARARENEIDFEPVSENSLREVEPNVAGLGALLVKETGIVDYRQVCDAMARWLENAGTRLMTSTRATAITEGNDGIHIVTDRGDTIHTGKLVACAGLQSDRIARLAGLE